MDEAYAVNYLLDMFDRASGLGCNMSKSSLSPIGCNEVVPRELVTSCVAKSALCSSGILVSR